MKNIIPILHSIGIILLSTILFIMDNNTEITPIMENETFDIFLKVITITASNGYEAEVFNTRYVNHDTFTEEALWDAISKYSTKQRISLLEYEIFKTMNLPKNVII